LIIEIALEKRLGLVESLDGFGGNAVVVDVLAIDLKKVVLCDDASSITTNPHQHHPCL
jgi:hypothetical protein